MNPQLLLQFITDHWLLVTVFFVLFILVFSYDRIHTQFSGLGVYPKALVQMINHQNAVVIDIRPKAQFVRGHIVNAVNFPAAEVLKDLTVLTPYQADPVVIVCHHDSEGAKLARLLKKQGTFHTVKILIGGMAQWTQANLPVEKEEGA